MKFYRKQSNVLQYFELKCKMRQLLLVKSHEINGFVFVQDILGNSAATFVM